MYFDVLYYLMAVGKQKTWLHAGDPNFRHDCCVTWHVNCVTRQPCSLARQFSVNDSALLSSGQCSHASRNDAGTAGEAAYNKPQRLTALQQGKKRKSHQHLLHIQHKGWIQAAAIYRGSYYLREGNQTTAHYLLPR